MDSSIGWLDMVAVGLMLVLGLFGAVRGAVRTVVGLVAGMAGVVLASRYGAELDAKTWPGIADMENAEAVGVGLGCAVVFVVVLVVGLGVAWILRKIIQRAELGAMDRLIGLAIGVAKGALVACVLAVAVMSVDLPSLRQGAEQSVTVARTRDVFDALQDNLPPEVAMWLGGQLGVEVTQRPSDLPEDDDDDSM
jgi:membrane protein required for colicin V production